MSLWLLSAVARVGLCLLYRDGMRDSSLSLAVIWCLHSVPEHSNVITTGSGQVFHQLYQPILSPIPPEQKQNW